MQKMFGTFFRNVPPENAFSNILKSFNRYANPKYLLHGVSASAKRIFLRQWSKCLIFHRYLLLIAFFFNFKMNVNSSSAQIIFLIKSEESKAISNFFFRLFFDLISAFNFQQTLSSSWKIEKKKSQKLVSIFALNFKSVKPLKRKNCARNRANIKEGKKAFGNFIEGRN